MEKLRRLIIYGASAKTNQREITK